MKHTPDIRNGIDYADRSRPWLAIPKAGQLLRGMAEWCAYMDHNELAPATEWEEVQFKAWAIIETVQMVAAKLKAALKQKNTSEPRGVGGLRKTAGWRTGHTNKPSANSHLSAKSGGKR